MVTTREDPIHDSRAVLDDGLDLMTADLLGDRRPAGVSDQPGDVLDGDTVCGQQ
jgi:hypothetical protein